MWNLKKKKKKKRKPKIPKPGSELVDTENRLVVARDQGRMGDMGESGQNK